MTYVTWKIERTDSDSNVTTFTDFSRPILELNLGEGKDSFSFDISNGNGDWDNHWQPRDKVTIYRVVNSVTTTTDNILMVGSVSDIPNQDTANKNTLKIKGYNYSEALMGTIVFVDATTLDVSETIQEALENASNFNNAFKVTWHPDNPDLKRDNTTSFPTVGKKYFYKTIKQILEELSSNQYTDDGRYYWYVNNSNQLIWRPDSGFGAAQFDDSTDGYKSKKVAKDTKDVVNYIVARGGYTPSGQAISAYLPDYSSIAKHGMKYHYLVDEAIDARNLVGADLQKDGAGEGDSYPDLSSTFTTDWKFTAATTTLANGTTATSNSTITFDTSTTGSEANSQADYNQAIKVEVKHRLREKMLKILEVRSAGRLQVDLALTPGQVSWGLGDVIRTTLDDFSTPKDLRVQEIQYSTTTDTYSLVEDVGTI